jgi:hypothetical protein
VSQDPADLTDADAFEELAHNIDPFPAVNHDQVDQDEFSYVPLGPEESANQTDSCNLEMMPTVVIEQFPHSSAGAPIPGHVQESYQDTCRHGLGPFQL